MNDSERLVMILGNATRWDERFTLEEKNESELLKDCRMLSEDDQRILREYAKEDYVPGLTPNTVNMLVHSRSSRGFCLAEKYAEMATVQDVRFYEEKLGWYDPSRILLNAEDINALDKLAESKGVEVRQFVHRLVPLKPNKQNKLMFSKVFRAAVDSAKTFDELSKANSLDIRWIPGLEGCRFDEGSYSSQLWLGRKNMTKYRKMLLKKVLELLGKLCFEESFKVALKFARYALPQDIRFSYYPSCSEGFENLASHMFIHFGGRQDLIDKMFKACLAKATFEQCHATYSQIHNGRVSAFAIVQMEKVAKTAEHHWTIAQIAFRRKNTKLWKRHLKKAAAKA